MSSQILAKDSMQFTSQMVGRLLPYEGQTAIQRFRHSSDCQPSLDRPLGALDPPGTGLSARSSATPFGQRGGGYATGGPPSPLPRTRRSRCGIWRPARNCARSPATPSGVYGVAVTADGRRAVSASWDNTLKVSGFREAAASCWLARRPLAVGSEGVAVTADGRRAVSASADNTLKVWDLESGEEMRTLAGHSSWGSMAWR